MLSSQERPSQSDLIVAAELLKNAAGLERRPQHSDAAHSDPHADGASEERSGSKAVFKEGGLVAASTELSQAYLYGEPLDAVPRMGPCWPSGTAESLMLSGIWPFLHPSLHYSVHQSGRRRERLLAADWSVGLTGCAATW